jgi:hypothetical protein
VVDKAKYSKWTEENMQENEPLVLVAEAEAV